MILIITPNDLPPDLREIPVEKLMRSQLPEHVRSCADLASIVIYGVTILNHGHTRAGFDLMPPSQMRAVDDEIAKYLTWAKP